MRKTSGIIWTLIAFCFLALIACAHQANRNPADEGVRSGTTIDNGLSPSTDQFMQRNHGGGRSTSTVDPARPLALPTLQAPAVGARLSSDAPVLAGFAPIVGSNSVASNVQPSYGWFIFAVALLFALIYAVRRSNARPDEQEPKIQS